MKKNALLQYKMNRKTDDDDKGGGGGGDETIESLKAKLSEFRDNNINLTKKLAEVEGIGEQFNAFKKQFEGIDPEQVKSIQETQRKITEKELIDRGEIETVFSGRVEVLKSDFNGKLSAKDAELERLKGELYKVNKRINIDSAAAKSLAENKINPVLHDAVYSMIKDKFTLADDGAVVAYDDKGQILHGADGGNLTIAGFVAGLDGYYKTPSSGGGSRGNDGGGGGGGENLNSRDNIRAGLGDL
jgi:hypothetical protein